MDQVRIELGIGQAGINLNLASIRTLAGAGGAGTTISMSQLHGKSAYTPMTVAGYDVDDTDYATGTAYTGNWYPQVAVTAGGNGSAKTYLWTFISNAGGFTLITNNAATGQVRHAVGKFGFTGSCVMNCRVTDSGGFVDKTVYVDVNIMDPAAP
jgi:hypothetical protein